MYVAISNALESMSDPNNWIHTTVALCFAVLTGIFTLYTAAQGLKVGWKATSWTAMLPVRLGKWMLRSPELGPTAKAILKLLDLPVARWDPKARALCTKGLTVQTVGDGKLLFLSHVYTGKDNSLDVLPLLANHERDVLTLKVRDKVTMLATSELIGHYYEYQSALPTPGAPYPTTVAVQGQEYGHPILTMDGRVLISADGKPLVRGG